MMCFWSCAVVSVQWYLIGYSLCLSNTGNWLIGNVDHVMLRNIGDLPATANKKIPALLVGIWYCLFAAITPTIIIGAVVERARVLPCVVFIFFWSTLVFDFLTYWTWNANGWLNLKGGLDYGGGTPVHISTGAAALSYALLVGERQDTSEKPPHNMAHVILGTSFIWFGWLIANAGSGLAPSLRAVTVMITTNMSAAVGAITWSVMDFRHERKWSALGFCCGMVTGLVAVTPASGYITPTSSILFGIVGAVVCNISMSFKHWLKIDDAFDVFVIHGVGGIAGNLLTGILADKSVAAVDGQIIAGGWIDGNWMQIGIQAMDTVVGFLYAFVMTTVILFVINKIPGLELRVDSEVEKSGLDRAETGFSMYEHVKEAMSTAIALPNLNGNSKLTLTKENTKAIHETTVDESIFSVRL
ncbi:ammonium transporter 1-like isoform X2 [Bradysia coprophila]|nr:ammonium transporter 1-like isoform X2 [Bradysia coprophila]